MWGFELVSPFFFLFFLSFFFIPVHLRTLSTCTQTPPSHTPTLAWPEAEAATQLQGLDDDDDDSDSLHPPRMHRPHSFHARPVVST